MRSVWDSRWDKIIGKIISVSNKRDCIRVVSVYLSNKKQQVRFNNKYSKVITKISSAEIHIRIFLIFMYKRYNWNPEGCKIKMLQILLIVKDEQNKDVGQKEQYLVWRC